MTKSLEEISKGAMQLPRDQRLALAKLLLDTEDPSDYPNSDALWHSEILHRAQAVEEGVAEGSS